MTNSQSGPESEAPRILIVDDEPVVRTYLMRVLDRTKCYELHEAADGIEAQGMLTSTDYDLVITDLQMPGMGGLELMRWAQENRPGTTWIILTGHGTLEDAVEAIHIGAFDFICKPLETPDVLEVTVRNALRQRRLEAERTHLHNEIEFRNERLQEQVNQLKDACQLLCNQAEIIEEDLYRAELIQQALLPRSMPKVKGYSINALYRPSRNVGGDLYDIVRFDNRTLGFYVADAAGHGVSAAMLAVLFKHRLRTIEESSSRPLQPAQVLNLVNKCIINECHAPGMFVTVAYCLLDTQNGKLSAASAGHPPLIIQRASGDCEMVYHTGPALGLSENASYTEFQTTLAPHDRLMLFTDGLLKSDGTTALVAEVIVESLNNSKLKGQAVLNSLLKKATKHKETTYQEDDITMLLISAEKTSCELDNGTPEKNHIEPAAALPGTSVLVGNSDKSTTISLIGRGTWTYATPFFETLASEIKNKHAIIIDLSKCTYLDSTFLGTIQEIVITAIHARSGVAIHGMAPEIRQLFEELGMENVLACAKSTPAPLPEKMSPLRESIESGPAQMNRIMTAHKVLASMNEANRQQFTNLIQGLQKELQRTSS